MGTPKSLGENEMSPSRSVAPSFGAIDSYRLNNSIRAAGIPKRYQNARISDFSFEIPHPNDHGLYLSAPAGRGKTHLATAIFINALPHVFSATWATVPEILLELRDSFGSDKTDVSEKRIITKYTRPFLLVLDDLGAEKSTDWTGQSIYTIISRRINDCKPTIVTSNLSRPEIHAVDPRLASRIGGMTLFFAFDGEDRRLK